MGLVVKMFLAGTFLAAGIIATFAPLLSASMKAVVTSSVAAGQVDTLIEVALPVATGFGLALAAIRRQRLQHAVAV